MDRAVELTTGNESQLTELIQSGDVSSAVQLAKAAIVAVDDDKKARPAVTQDQLTEKRKEVIMEKFAAFVLLLYFSITLSDIRWAPVTCSCFKFLLVRHSSVPDLSLAPYKDVYKVDISSIISSSSLFFSFPFCKILQSLCWALAHVTLTLFS